MYSCWKKLPVKKLNEVEVPIKVVDNIVDVVVVVVVVEFIVV
jgi:hypothetical protein